MKRYNKLLCLTLAFVLAIGMSTTSVFAASKAKSVKITTPKKSPYTMVAGKTKQFKVKVSPKGLKKNVKWTSSKKSVATVSKKGKVKAKKSGKTVIQAKVGNKKSKKITVIVKAPVTKVTLSASKTSININESLKINAKLSPAYPTSTKLAWSSSDDNIATVSKDGVVTGKNLGKVTIKAASTNKKVGEITINVTARTDYPMTSAVKNLYAKTDEAYAKKVTEKLAYEFGDDETGFITSGGDAEINASKYLAKEFKSIGLKEVQRVPVVVDKWQFNDASLNFKYKDGNKTRSLILTNGNEEIVSYASSGTKQSKKNVNWNNIGIVDAGSGTKSEYKELADKGIDVTDKIVLVGVNQWNDYWIDAYYMEAFEQGAAAIISYQTGGYGLFNNNGTDPKAWDTINMQDMCAEDLGIPNLSISPKSAAKIQAALTANEDSSGAPVSAKLFVDNEVVEDQVTYNVVGKIKGSGDSDQQILYAGHYDKYFEGYQDDAAAVGLTAGIAKAMVDSGYKPYNDIYFIAHAAEEWGQAGTSTDWAYGSWQMIKEAKPEWRGSTLAIINFESPAIIPNFDYAKFGATPEISSVLDNFRDTDLMNGTANKVFSKPLQSAAKDGFSMTDGVSYQFNGVPVVDDSTTRNYWPAMPNGDLKGHSQTKYHTQYDNADTYSKDVMDYKIKAFSAVGMYIDGTPAIDMDMGYRADALKDSAPSGDAAYDSAVTDLEDAGSAYQGTIDKLNADYLKAFREDDTAKMGQLRTEAKSANIKSLEALQKSQDAYAGLSSYDTVDLHHVGLKNNIDILSGVIDNLEGGDAETALDEVGALWSDYEYYALDFSKEVCERSVKLVNGDYVKNRNLTNWSVDKISPQLPSYETTQKMMDIYDASGNSGDYTAVISEYKSILTELQGLYDGSIDKVKSDTSDLVDFLNN